MSRFRLTPLAAADLEEIYSQIAQHRPTTAFKIVERLRDKFRILAKHPLLGQEKLGYGREYRCFATERWVIFYIPIPDGIEVHRVLDGARDVDTELR
jgi:toxin ParE1/3/4